MTDFRCYLDSKLRPSPGESVELSPEESAHLVASNRCRPGQEVRLFDGQGIEWDSRLERADKRRARLLVTKAYPQASKPFEMALAQSLPKGKVLEATIRKATEIGASAIYPISTARTEFKIDQSKVELKNAKWTHAAIEGAKQSGNPYLPRIAAPQSLSSLLRTTEDYELKLIASLSKDARLLSQHLAEARDAKSDLPVRSAIWLVGPEGDFTKEESLASIKAGFLPTRLSPHVLRCETAAIYALSITQQELST